MDRKYIEADMGVMEAERKILRDRLGNANTLLELQEIAHKNAMIHGFYDEIMDCNALNLDEARYRDFVLSQLAKIMGEGGEAVSVIQHSGVEDEGLAEELADIIIRVIDLAGYLDIDIHRSVKNKMLKNIDRPYMHGKTC